MTAAPETTDTELVARLSQGDEAALRELYRRCAPLVFAVAVRILPAAQAEEVVQEVFLTVWRKHDTFDPSRGSPRTWLARIARNRALNEARRTRRRAETGDEALESVADDAPGPDEALWAARRQEAVRVAVGALPPALGRTLSLAFLDELTHEQVAAALGTPLGTTKTRIRAALKRLAPLVAAAVALVVAVIGGLFWQRAEREERALVTVTSSDVVPRRLEATPGVPSDAHGQFRSRPGSAVAVLTTTKLPPLASGERYVAWARHGARWTRLGVVEPGHEAHALLVAEDEALANSPDDLRVTREIHVGEAPGEVVVISWKP